MKFTIVCLLMAFLAGCNSEHSKDKEKTTESVAVQTQAVEGEQQPEMKTDSEEEEKPVEKDIKKEKLKIVDISTNNGVNPSVDISFSQEIQEKNLESYIKIEPYVETKAIKMRDHIVLTGNFDVAKKYTLRILKGFEGDGEKLQNDIVTEIAFKELEPKILFSNDGIILPKVNGNKIAFRSVNIKKVRVKVEQIFLNNITQFLQDFEFKGNGNSENYEVKDNLYRVGEKVLDKSFDLKYEKNIWSQNEVDLSNIVKEKGIYVVSLSFDKNGVDYKFPEGTAPRKEEYYFDLNGTIGKAVLITDMGIIAQQEKDGKIIADVLDVITNKPVQGATVKAVTFNNQLIEEVKTDSNGEIIINNGSKVFYLVAEKGNEFSILKLSDSKLSYDGFLVDGEFGGNGTRAFIYSGRGIYRPGDEINIGIIARTGEKDFPQDQPVKIDVFTPRGDKYIDGSVIKENLNGFFTFNFKTEQTDETGLWTVVAYVGGDQNKKFTLKVPVETVVPYKIDVETEFPKDINIKNTTEIVGSIKSKYLFGNPAGGLKFSSDINLRKKNIEFSQYKNFEFNNPTTYIPSFSMSKTGELDKNGESSIVFSNIPKDIPGNITLNGVITTRVIESGGRPVINTNNIEINKFESYAGIEVPEDSFVKSGDGINLQAVAVSGENGKYVAGRKMRYRIYKNEYSWWWDYYNYTDFLRSIKNDKNTVLLYEKEFETTDQPYLIDYALEGSGEIFVEVEDMETKQSAGTNLYVSTWQDPSISKVIDKLKMETDKKKYSVGEKAKVTFEGEEGTRALITVTKSGRILQRYWKDAEGVVNSVDVDVASEMFPNAYVTVALFQKYGNTQNDRPLRLYGAVPIMVNDPEKKLDITLDTPDELHPNEKFKVKIVNKDQGKIDYTISVVDEGILGITGFKTPNPYDYFYSKEGLELSAYDNYSEIIGRTFGDVHQILTPGGDFYERSLNMAAKLNQLGFDQSERFKPLSIFKGVLQTDDQGKGEVEIELPNYNGAVRVMITAANGGQYGMAEKRVEVKSPIIADITMPRVLKVGDKFQIPVKVFALEKDLGSIDVVFNFLGKDQSQTLQLSEGENKELIFEVEVGNKIGNEVATLEIKSSKYSTKHEIDIDVAADNPYTVLNSIEYIKDGETEFSIPQESVVDSVNGELTISSYPILAIDNRIQEMIRYPYGCLEQTVSAAFPQLFIDEVATGKIFDKQKIVKNVNMAISRLANYQIDGGGFGYWAGSDSVNYWATIYAGQFMVLAEDKGYYVPESLYKNWIKFAKEMTRDKDISNDLKAYTLYVLALAQQPEVGELNYIYDNNFKDLSLIGKWYIAGAYEYIGEHETAKKIAGSLSKNVTENRKKDVYYDFGSDMKNKAVILDIYYEIFNEVDKDLYSDIVTNLQSDNWLSTQSIGYSMLVLGNLNEGTKGKPVKGTVIINGQSTNFDKEDGKYQLSLDSSVHSIAVRGNNLYVNRFWEGIPVKYNRDTEFNNMILERKFYAENGEEIDVKSLQAGTTFYMELKVLPEKDEDSYFNVENVALTQILPSGWEIENIRALGIEYPQWIEDIIGGNSMDYEDIRDDRVNFFFNFNNYGSAKKGQSFFVKLNAVTKGEFNLPGAVAQAMYDGDYNAYLKGFEVEVK